MLPAYIKTSTSKHQITYDEPTETSDGKLILYLEPVFIEYKKYSRNNVVPSVFNFSYYVQESSNKKTALSCVRVKSTEEKPRFLIAYDSDYLSESEVIYIINCMFRYKY